MLYKDWYVLDNFRATAHAAIALDKVLLTAEDREAHEKLTQNRRYRGNSDSRIQIKTVE